MCLYFLIFNKICKYSRKHKMPKSTQEKNREFKLTSKVSIIENKLGVKYLFFPRNPAPDGFIGELYQTLKKHIVLILNRL